MSPYMARLLRQYHDAMSPASLPQRWVSAATIGAMPELDLMRRSHMGWSWLRPASPLAPAPAVGGRSGGGGGGAPRGAEGGSSLAVPVSPEQLHLSVTHTRLAWFACCPPPLGGGGDSGLPPSPLPVPQHRPPPPPPPPTAAPKEPFTTPEARLGQCSVELLQDDGSSGGGRGGGGPPAAPPPPSHLDDAEQGPMELGPVVAAYSEMIIPVTFDADAGLLCCLLLRDPNSHLSRGLTPGTFCPTIFRAIVDVRTAEMLAMSASEDGALSVVEHTPRNGTSHSEFFVARAPPPTVNGLDGDEGGDGGRGSGGRGSSGGGGGGDGGGSSCGDRGAGGSWGGEDLDDALVSPFAMLSIAAALTSCSAPVSTVESAAITATAAISSAVAATVGVPNSLVSILDSFTGVFGASVAPPPDAVGHPAGVPGAPPAGHPPGPSNTLCAVIRDGWSDPHVVATIRARALRMHPVQPLRLRVGAAGAPRRGAAAGGGLLIAGAGTAATAAGATAAGGCGGAASMSAGARWSLDRDGEGGAGRVAADGAEGESGGSRMRRQSPCQPRARGGGRPTTRRPAPALVALAPAPAALPPTPLSPHARPPSRRRTDTPSRDGLSAGPAVAAAAPVAGDHAAASGAAAPPTTAAAAPTVAATAGAAASVPGAAAAPPPLQRAPSPMARTGPRKRNLPRRRGIDLAELADERTRARILRNREAARASNLRKQAAARAAAAAASAAATTATEEATDAAAATDVAVGVASPSSGSGSGSTAALPAAPRCGRGVEP